VTSAVFDLSAYLAGRLAPVEAALERAVSGLEGLLPRDVAGAVARLNSELMGEERPYLLIGVGRWGSSDPWLGIPVGWEQIAGARVIVEAGFADFKVTPSQGSHFFQNLTSFAVGYFTVNPEAGEGQLDWEWLASCPSRRDEGGVRHLRLERPLLAQVNGTRGEGVILKPPA